MNRTPKKTYQSLIMGSALIITNSSFENILTEILHSHGCRIQDQLEFLFMVVTSSGMNMGDGETTTPLSRWVSYYNDYQEQLVKILNHKIFSIEDTKDDILKAGGRPALIELLSPSAESKEFIRVLKASVVMKMNLDIRNSSENSPLGFACENGHKEVVQLIIPFLGDEGLNHKNKYGNTPRDIARIHGYEEIDYILTDELIQRGMEEQGSLSKIFGNTKTIVKPWE